MLGYVTIYVITPYDLAWHVRTSLGRLLMQLWPAVLFTFFLRIAIPERALARSAASSGTRPDHGPVALIQTTRAFRPRAAV
jgi:hypothetical protein